MSLIPKSWLRNVSKFGARWTLGVLLTLLAALQVAGFVEVDPVDRMDTFIDGLRMRVEPPVLDKRIVIVDIDEASLAKVGRWPWNRDVMAQLVTKMAVDYAARAIGFDVVFAEPDTSSGYSVLAGLAEKELKDVPGFRARLAALKPAMDFDAQLASAIAGQPVVLGYTVSSTQRQGLLPPPAFTPDDLNGRDIDALESEGYAANLPQLQRAARGGGIFTAVIDADGVLRRSTLVQRIGANYYPSLSLATAAVALQAKAIKPVFFDTIDTLSAAELDNGGLDHLSIIYGDGRQIGIPVGVSMTTVIQYRGGGGPRGGAFAYVPAAAVLDGSADKAVLKNAIILVGTTAPGLNDLRATPVNREYPGVEVHANLIKSILDNSFKHRPDYAFACELLQVLAVGVLLSVALAMLSPLPSILAAGAALLAAGGFNWFMYSAPNNVVLNLSMIVLLILALFMLNLGWGYFFEFRKGRALVSRFGEYVAPELVAEMADNPDSYNMDGESRELTVLFVDVRGFTTISEGLTPKALREYINLYLTAMSEDIRDSHHGTLDKYIGDAVMAFWGAPVAFPDHASRAVATSLLMQASAGRLNADFVARGWPPLKIGIGLNSGLMHVGDMGSKIRRAYTVMGDAVNLGARLEGITKVYGVGIAVGQATRAGAPEFAYRELDLVRVKGKNEPVAIFEPLGLGAEVSAATLAQVERWHRALALVRQQQWDQADALIAALAVESPACGLYALYRERIAFYRLQPPGDGWDGVTTFETK